jgi:predicted DNA-binding transcriptional regulator AlpA
MANDAILKLINNAQTAERIGVRPSTLEIWRVQGKGPAFRKIGRLVRYAESDVQGWLAAQTRTSTSQVLDSVES